MKGKIGRRKREEKYKIPVHFSGINLDQRTKNGQKTEGKFGGCKKTRRMQLNMHNLFYAMFGGHEGVKG